MGTGKRGDAGTGRSGPLRRPAPRVPRGPHVSASYFRLIVEKTPLLILSAGSCVQTIRAQSVVRAFKPLELQYRAINALLSYAAYIRQMFFPTGMVVQYVHRGPNLQWQDALIPLAILVPITLAVGWLGLAAALPGRRLALVFGHARAGDRIGAGGRPSPGRPLYLPDADRPVHHDRLGAERSGADMARTDGSIRCRRRAGHRRAGRHRLAADFAVGRTASPCGHTASPASRKTISPRTSTARPWPTPAGSTRPWNTTPGRSKSIPSTSRQRSTTPSACTSRESRPKPWRLATLPCRSIRTTPRPTSLRPWPWLQPEKRTSSVQGVRGGFDSRVSSHHREEPQPRAGPQ